MRRKKKNNNDHHINDKCQLVQFQNKYNAGIDRIKIIESRSAYSLQPLPAGACVVDLGGDHLAGFCFVDDRPFVAWLGARVDDDDDDVFEKGFLEVLLSSGGNTELNVICVDGRRVASLSEDDGSRDVAFSAVDIVVVIVVVVVVESLIVVDSGNRSIDESL